MSAHTPGPWAWETNVIGNFTLMSQHDEGFQGCGTAVIDGMRWTLDWHDGAESDWERISEEEWDANARLIAAAPETAAERDRLKIERDALLAAAETVLASLKWEDDRSGTTYNGVDSLRATIAQARKGGV